MVCAEQAEQEKKWLEVEAATATKDAVSAQKKTARKERANGKRRVDQTEKEAQKATCKLARAEKKRKERNIDPGVKAATKAANKKAQIERAVEAKRLKRQEGSNRGM